MKAAPASQTANRYLNFLLAGTTVSLFVLALSKYFALPLALPGEQMGETIQSVTQSWRWWLLTGLSLILFFIVIVLERVGAQVDDSGRLFLGLLSLTVLWSIALAISGGAENAVNAIQLILIAAAFMTLNARRAWVIFSLVVAVQVLFLLMIFMQGVDARGGITHNSMAHSHQNQAHDHLHYVAMSATFLVAAGLLALVIRRMQRSLQQQQTEVQAMREEQLRQEQILAMGTASAQITHELATPLSTISMIYDELEEHYPQQRVISDLKAPIAEVRNLLQNLRAVAEQIQTQQQQNMSLIALQTQLQQQVSLHFALAQVNWQIGHEELSSSNSWVRCDLTLVPALLGLIRNAIEASADGEEEGQCDISSWQQADMWLLHVRNPTTQTSRLGLQDYSQLGKQAVSSQRGLGFGMLLSHATLERFAGGLRVQLDENGIFHQYIHLPLNTSETE